MRQISSYSWHTGRLARPMRLAVISDLHNKPYQDLLPFLKDADCLLVPGDIADRYHQTDALGLQFLSDAARRCPTFFSIGNHDFRLRRFGDFLQDARGTGATVLYNQYAAFGPLVIGGWYLPSNGDMLLSFQREPGVKVLMCHKPEHYFCFLRGTDTDLVLAGHAHGGQIRLGGQGFYAPGQGVMPRYTKGVYEEKLLVSAGASNNVRIPRWGNPCEMVMIDLD